MSRPVIRLKPNPACKACKGQGEVYDYVPAPFGSGNCAMASFCDCVTAQVPKGQDDAAIDLDLSHLDPEYYHGDLFPAHED